MEEAVVQEGLCCIVTDHYKLLASIKSKLATFLDMGGKNINEFLLVCLLFHFHLQYHRPLTFPVEMLCLVLILFK